MRRQNGIQLAALVALFCFSPSFAQSTSNPTNDPDAEKTLQTDLDSLIDIKTLAVKFICEKRLAMLETPLVSGGNLWIARDPKHGVSVRFSTDVPYTSELILADGKTYARSQHETKWTTTTQSSRPGLTAVMMQLGGWSTGDAGKLSEMYAVARSDEKVPERPTLSGATAAATAKAKSSDATDVFALTPTNKDLAIAIKRVTLAMTRPHDAKQPSRLTFIEIETAQSDTTRYWFFDPQVDAKLPADIFKPTAEPEKTP